MTYELRQVLKRWTSESAILNFLIFPEPWTITKIDQKVTKLIKEHGNGTKM